MWRLYRAHDKCVLVQVPSPGIGRGEDSGCFTAQGQGQPVQHHPHVGVLLLQKPSLYHIRTHGVGRYFDQVLEITHTL